MAVSKTPDTGVTEPGILIWASMTGMLLLYLFLRKGRIRMALVCGLGGYFFALLCNNYYFLVEGTGVQKWIDLYLKITTSARNGVFDGFLFLGIGVWLSQLEKEERIEKNIKWIWPAVILSWLIMLGEIAWIEGKVTADDNSLFLGQVIFVPLFVAALLHTKCGLDEKKAVLCRNLSVGIYFLHRPVLQLLRYIGWFAGLSGIIQFIILALVCTLFCFSVYAGKKEPLYSLLR